MAKPVHRSKSETFPNEKLDKSIIWAIVHTTFAPAAIKEIICIILLEKSWQSEIIKKRPAVIIVKITIYLSPSVLNLENVLKRMSVLYWVRTLNNE